MKNAKIILIFLTLLFYFFIGNMKAISAEVPKENTSSKENASSIGTKTDISCKYYSVKMPDNWKVVKAPEETNGNINAIFTSKNGSSTVSIVMGPALGSDAKTIASMFAEQFKSVNNPVEKNNTYSFSFRRNNIVHFATTIVDNDIFKLITISGNQKSAQKFIANSIITKEELKDSGNGSSIPAQKNTSEKDISTENKMASKEAAANPDKASQDVSAAHNEEKASNNKDEKLQTNKLAPSDAQENTNNNTTSNDNSSSDPINNKTVTKHINEDNKQEKEGDKKAKEGQFITEFYTVSLPQGWKAVMPPKEEGGNLNAIFATDSGATIVTFIIGPSLGADAKTIASMFAEQFKSANTPTVKNGKYMFSFPYNNGQAQAIVSTSGTNFMLITISGSKDEADKFISKSVKSENFDELLPR